MILKQIKDYCNDILSGKILACQKHKWACLRFLNDLDKSALPDYPYKFDEEKAERFFLWMEMFCHTKGPLAGKPKIPEPIERFIFGNIYGWVDRETGYRRFRYSYYQVARKNAKSQDLAIVGLYELACMGESCSEVLVAATKKEQTKYVWEEADLIIRRCKIKIDGELLKEKFRTVYGVIRHIKSDSTFIRMSEEDKKKGDGSNPQCGILDEYQAQETDENYNVLTSGMKTRVQPILMIITTAGFDLNNPCYTAEYDYVSKILNPDNPIENEQYFAIVCELDKNETGEPIEIDGQKIGEGELIDNIKDESVWVKANPINTKTAEGMASIRSELQVALDKPDKMRDFLTKSMNVWVNERDCAYMPMNKWAVCKGEIPDLKGKSCYIGFDLSAKIDLTSVTFEFPVDDKYYVLNHSFLPEDTLPQRRKMGKVPYDRWIAGGWITATPGPVVDYRLVRDYAIERAKENGWYIEEICGDPWGFLQIGNDLIDSGYEVVEIVQGIKTLSEPTKDFRDMVYLKRVIHDGNPVLTWAVGNAIADQVDRNKNIILNKKKSKENIDPIAATINAHVRAMVKQKDGTGRVIFI